MWSEWKSPLFAKSQVSDHSKGKGRKAKKTEEKGRKLKRHKNSREIPCNPVYTDPCKNFPSNS